ncbi:sulfurtransferase [Kytococcus sedentarius]|uniref:sulfurtransferase n=1 Tax=Kytococcus sedentarius TaxID=1276 RepID=UPI0035BC6C57
MSTALVGIDELADALDSPHRPVVLDVRWDLGGGPDRAGFAAGHVPTSRFLDLEEVLTGPAGPDGAGGRHPLPDPARVRTWLGEQGIDPEHPVIVLDGGHGAGAARAWWVLRDAGLQDVRVLDGGLAAWTEAGHPVETGQTGQTGQSARPGSPSSDAPSRAPDGHRLPTRDAADLLAGPRAGEVLLDARPAARYRGEDLGPDPVGGHIPGATNLPVASLYDGGRLREVEEVRQRFAEAGVEQDTDVVLSCGSGITACQLALAHAVAFPEADEPVLYPGSFSDWISDPSRPLATGAAPGAMPPG